MNTNALAIIQRKGPTQKAREIVSAKPVLGKPLGNFKLKLKYLDGRALELGGFVSDVTGLFIGEKAQRAFRKVIFEQAKSMGFIVPDDAAASQKTSDNTDSVNEDSPLDVDVSAIEGALVDLGKFDFMKCCRVFLLEGSGNKHLVLQIRRLKLLTEYAYNIDTAQWSYLKGLQYDYLLDGRASSLPYSKPLRGVGEVFIHVFIPDDDRSNLDEDSKYLEDAKALTPIVPMIREIGDVDEVLKAKDDEVEANRWGMKKLKAEFSEKATYNMNADIAITGLEGEGKLPESSVKSFGAFQYLAIIGLGFLVGWIGSTFNVLGWPIGFALGNLGGLALIAWRK